MIDVDDLTLNQHFSCFVPPVVGAFRSIDGHPFFSSCGEMVILCLSNHIILHLMHVGEKMFVMLL